MKAAQALQAAVFAVANVTYAEPVTIRGTNVTVSMKFGSYTVSHDLGTVKFLDRDRAIDLIKRCLVN
jgi:hypothetical protein